MAGTQLSTLYPPIVETFQPAFPADLENIIIPFSISPYNSSSGISAVHVSVQNQSNNENSLKVTNGVLVVPLRFNADSGTYYVSISKNRFKNLTTNQFYKVQLRFDNNPDSNAIPLNVNENDGGDATLRSYLQSSANKPYFSEWSQVTLLRPIPRPSILLQGFDNSNAESIPSFNKGIVPIVGFVSFSNSSEETLQSYQISILNKENEVVLQDDIIYTGDKLDPNEINTRIDLQGLNTDVVQDFILRIHITTKNMYEVDKDYEFRVADYLTDDNFKPTISVNVDNENGIAEIHITNELNVFGLLHIKRASSIDNFENWQTIRAEKIQGPIDINFSDNTIGSLVWYRYSVQLENSSGGLTKVYRSQKILPDFYNAIISREDKQFKIKYNYQISSMKPIVNRTKIDTLGGRYPKFAENAILNYKQFSISGIITAMNGDNDLFLDRREYFDNDYENYLRYSQQDYSDIDGDINYRGFAYREDDADFDIYIKRDAFNKNDYFWEREFREEAIKWLNDGEPKLYRSMTEGAIVVMITDISLTPNAQLSRRMWNFSATMYEIEEADNLEKLDSLGIYEIVGLNLENSSSIGGAIDPADEYIEVVKVGQLYETALEHNNNFLTDIQNNIKQRYSGILADKIPDNFYLKNVKIYFHSMPSWYRFKDNNNIEQIDDDKLLTYPQTDRLALGYGIRIGTNSFDMNGSSTIFVNQKGYYEVPDNLNVQYITLLNKEDIITVEYVLVYKEKNNISNIVSSQEISKTVIGQIYDSFKANNYLGELIKEKYNFIINTNDFSYTEKMISWIGIGLDVDPFSLVKLKYTDTEKHEEYLIGPTGTLDLMDKYDIQDICFTGRRMKQVPFNRQPYLDPWEFCVKDDKPLDYDPSVLAHTVNWYTMDGADTGQKIVFNFGADNEIDLIQDQWNNGSDIEDGSNDPSKIKNPLNGCVYNVGNNCYKIYLNNTWYDFDSVEKGLGIARIPVQGAINYIGHVVRYNHQ